MCKYLLILSFSMFIGSQAHAQCFASSGNPVGGSANLGVMDKNKFRISAFYKYSYSDKYYHNNIRYAGEKGILKSADYNYIGWLGSYGINDQRTLEAEAGYYLNKTQVYKTNNIRLTGSGLSNAVLSLKQRLFHNADKRTEISIAAGANIPFSRTLIEKDGVVLPIDIQPSTGSYGIVLQTSIIKENSFKGIRYLYSNRIEKYFENKQEYIFGNSYSNSLYFSKHYVFEKYIIKDWTLIMQLRNQIKSPNTRAGKQVEASGNTMFLLVPQINISINDTWNFSVLSDIPVYQYYRDIQLANKISFGLVIIKDF